MPVQKGFIQRSLPFIRCRIRIGSLPKELFHRLGVPLCGRQQERSCPLHHPCIDLSPHSQKELHYLRTPGTRGNVKGCMLPHIPDP